MKRALIAGFLSIVLMATACTTEDDEPAATDTSAQPTSTAPAADPDTTDPDTTDADGTVPEDEPETTVEPIVDPRAPGVTDDEIVIGVAYTDFTNIRDFVDFDHGDYETAYGAMIDKVNAEGGIHGRMLVPQFAAVDPLGSDSAAAACTQLTQDRPSFVVVGFFLADDVLCYLETNPTAVIGGEMTPERLSRADAPWYSLDPSSDATADAVRALGESGELDGVVAAVGAAGDEALYEESIEPVLAELGIEPVEVAYLDAPEGDINALLAAAETASLRFESLGVDQLLLMSRGVGTFPQGLARTAFRPALVWANLDAALTYSTGEGNDLSLLEGSTTAGGFDSRNSFREMGGATAECVEIQTDAGLELLYQNEIEEGDSQQWTSSWNSCRNIELLAAILEAAGPELNYGTYETAGNSLGEIELAGSPDPFTFGAPPAADGNPPTYVYAFDPAVETFVGESG